MSTKEATKNKSGSNKKFTTERYINPKNYLYAFLILVGGVLIALYGFKWYQVKKEEKLMNSYLIQSKTIESNTDIESLNDVMNETPSSYFIYIGYRNDEYVYNLEKNLKRVIDKYKLNDSFYYIDVTNLKEQNDNYINEIKSKLELDNLNNIPAILFYKDNELVKVLDGINNTMLKSSDLEQLLEIYEFEKVK